MDPQFRFAHSHPATPSPLWHQHQDDNSSGSALAEPAIDNLYPALVQCFGIILLGYLAGKFSFINDIEAKGLGTFIGTFSLPALIFVSLCQLNFSSVNWLFLLAVAIAKCIVFFLVLLIGIVVKWSDISRSALYAIFVTQSNDFALGYPVLSAIYGKSHPDYPMYLYLLAPISLAFLNPIGFILMEIGKSREEAMHGNQRSSCRIAQKVVFGIASNPLMVMTVLGILGNLVFHHIMPEMIHGFLSTLGSAFSASALFLLGLRMVGKSVSVTGSQALVIPFLLIVVKSLVLPLVTREIVSQMNPGTTVNDSLDLSNFGFLYGTIPTAPSVFVYAVNYGVIPDLIAATITASTFIAAPIMFVSAKLLMIKNLDPEDYIDEIDVFLFDISIVGTIAGLWVIFVLLMTKKAHAFPHQLTALLALCQAVACVGAMIWSFLDCRHGWKLYLQFLVYGFGVLGSRINTALLAIALLLQAKGQCRVNKYRKWILGTGLLLPLILVSVLTLVVAVETPEHGKKEDPNFQYGPTQAVVVLVVIIIALLVTVVSLILKQRIGAMSLFSVPKEQTGSERERLLPDSEGGSGDNNAVAAAPCGSSAAPDIEDITSPRTEGCGGNGARRYRCDSTHREYCSNLIRRYEVPPGEDAMSPDNVLRLNTAVNSISYNDGTGDPLEMAQHTLLLLLLSISMFVGGALCLWTLLMESMSGIYLELVFLDGFLNLGQSLFTLALFGINTKGIYLKLRVLLRRVIYRRDKIQLPAWEDLAMADRSVSTIFIKHHVAACMEDILHDINQGLRRHLASFYGTELVSWLVERGLAQSRQEAEMLGRQLLRGRVIRHVDDHIDFYDDKFVYTFLPENRRLRD